VSTVTKTKNEPYKSESSIFSHPIQYPKATHAKFPTWALIAVLFVAFFILKVFIYIKDNKRHGL
jgi:hypothetical protein